MPREVFVTVGRYLRKIIDGKGCRCKVCDKVINYDLVTKKELRHSCQLPDHPAARGEHSMLAQFDDDLDESEWSPEAGRLERGFDMLGYGEELTEYTAIEERW